MSRYHICAETVKPWKPSVRITSTCLLEITALFPSLFWRHICWGLYFMKCAWLFTQEQNGAVRFGSVFGRKQKECIWNKTHSSAYSKCIHFFQVFCLFVCLFAILHILWTLMFVYSRTLSHLFLGLHFAIIAYLWNSCSGCPLHQVVGSLLIFCHACIVM